jgi:hypothetical protein
VITKEEFMITDLRSPTADNGYPIDTPPTIESFVTDIPRIDYQIFDLLQGNLECELPCWWGIYPGKSELIELESFFEVYGNANNSYIDYDNNIAEISFFMDPPGLFLSNFYVAADNKINKIIVYTQLRDSNNDYNALYGDQKYFEIIENYLLNNILEKYGIPSRVLIRSFRPSPSWFDTQTLIYYPSNGIMIQYNSENSLVINDGQEYIMTCPLHGFVSLLLFDPSDNYSIEELVQEFGYFSEYKDLDLVTSFSLEDFYKNNLKSTCEDPIITPAEFWPFDY